MPKSGGLVSLTVLEARGSGIKVLADLVPAADLRPCSQLASSFHPGPHTGEGAKQLPSPPQEGAVLTTCSPLRLRHELGGDPVGKQPQCPWLTWSPEIPPFQNGSHHIPKGQQSQPWSGCEGGCVLPVFMSEHASPAAEAHPRPISLQLPPPPCEGWSRPHTPAASP